MEGGIHTASTIPRRKQLLGIRLSSVARTTERFGHREVDLEVLAVDVASFELAVNAHPSTVQDSASARGGDGHTLFVHPQPLHAPSTDSALSLYSKSDDMVPRQRHCAVKRAGPGGASV